MVVLLGAPELALQAIRQWRVARAAQAMPRQAPQARLTTLISPGLLAEEEEAAEAAARLQVMLTASVGLVQGVMGSLSPRARLPAREPQGSRDILGSSGNVVVEDAEEGLAPLPQRREDQEDFQEAVVAVAAGP